MSKGLEIAKLFENSLKLALTVESAVSFPNSGAIIAFSQQEPNQTKSRDFFKYYNTYFPLSSSVGSSFSPSRTFRLSLQEGEKKENLFWELWTPYRIRQVKDLKKIHSFLAAHPCFGRIVWSSNEKYVLYTAEAIGKKSAGFWSGEEIVGDANMLKENFGENLKNITDPRLFVYDTEMNDAKEVDIGVDVYPAQPWFKPGSSEFVFVGYEKFAYKLGVSAMINRKTKLYRKNMETGKAEEIPIPDAFMAVQFPKYSPDGKFISYYGVPKGTISHCPCVALVLYSTETQETRILIDIVTDFNENFNGIYGFHDSLAAYNWLDNSTIIFQTPHNASEVIFTTDLSGNITELPLPMEKPYSASILDISHGSVLIKASTFTVPEHVFQAIKSQEWDIKILDKTFASWGSQDPSNAIPHSLLSSEELSLQNSISSYKTTIIPHTTSSIKSVLYHKPENSTLIVIIHGGPHASGPVNYNYSSSLRFLLGFNSLVVNYRGSIGFGSKHLDALLGNIGTMDVADCIEAINQAQQVQEHKKIIAYGGSHGGFLSLHLASAMKLDGCISINGALNPASMILATDITDWGFAEVLTSEPRFPPTVEDYAKLYQASPLSRVASVKCPVLLICGGGDLRVPPAATMETYRALKGLGVDTQVFWYPEEGHGLLGKASAYDVVVNVNKWIAEKVIN